MSHVSDVSLPELLPQQALGLNANTIGHVAANQYGAQLHSNAYKQHRHPL